MLKRVFSVLVVTVLSLLAMILPATAADYSYLKTVEITIGMKSGLVNGLPSTMDQPAFIKNGRSLIPFRFLGEALGAEVSWQNASKAAVLKIRGTEVMVIIGSNSAYINGKRVILDVPAELKGGRTFIPMRFVSEALGADVEFDGDTKTVSVSLVDTTGWKEYRDLSGDVLVYPADWKATVVESVYSFDIISPIGSRVYLGNVQKAPSTIIAEKKAEYLKAGFKITSEDPIDPANPAKGTNIGFIMRNSKDINDSDIYMLSVEKDTRGTIILELLTKIGNFSKDMPIFNKMFSK